MPAKSKCIAFSPKKNCKTLWFTEQICLDFTEQAQKKNPTSILNKYPKAQPKSILKKQKTKKQKKPTKTQYEYVSASIIKW